MQGCEEYSVLRDGSFELDWGILVALPGLEPGLFALRGRRVNQLHQ